jgi:hypothetical protein
VGLLILLAIAGKHLLAAVYDGPLTPVLGHMLEGRGVHSVEHYHSVLNRRGAHLLATIVAVAVALMCVSFASQSPVAVVFALDLLFIAVDRSFGVIDKSPVRFSVSRDGGYPELFQYVKEAGIGVTFALLYWRRHCGMYLVWSALFLYLMLDDALTIHEELGLFLSTRFEFPGVMGLRPQDLGELLVMGTVGTLSIGLLAVTYRQAVPSERRTILPLLALLGVLGLFGVGFDMVAIAVDSRWIEFLEDAGEMLVISAILGYAHRCLMQTAVTEH